MAQSMYGEMSFLMMPNQRLLLNPAGIDKGDLICILCVMAKQTGDIKVTGAIDSLSFYKMYDSYFVRTKYL